ncbi:MAG: DUF3817 domain-containing protein [Limisphaerales bacterium]
MKSPIPFLRKVALIEGTSFLLLLAAMPLKYGMGIPGPVKVIGWAHGVLFVLFCLALLQTFIVAKWSLGRATLIFISSLVPFGPFLVDKRMKSYDEEFRLKRAVQPSVPVSVK